MLDVTLITAACLGNIHAGFSVSEVSYLFVSYKKTSIYVPKKEQQRRLKVALLLF